MSLAGSRHETRMTPAKARELAEDLLRSAEEAEAMNADPDLAARLHEAQKTAPSGDAMTWSAGA